MKVLIVDNDRFENVTDPYVQWDGWDGVTRIFDGKKVLAERQGHFRSWRILEESAEESG